MSCWIKILFPWTKLNLSDKQWHAKKRRNFELKKISNISTVSIHNKYHITANCVSVFCKWSGYRTTSHANALNSRKSWRFHFTCQQFLSRWEARKIHSRVSCVHLKGRPIHKASDTSTNQQQHHKHGREFKFSSWCMHALKCKIAIGYYVWFLLLFLSLCAVIEFAFRLFTQKSPREYSTAEWETAMWMVQKATNNAAQLQASRVREFTFCIFLSFRFAFPPSLMPDFFILFLRNFNLVFIFGELITSFLSAAPPSTACAFWCFVESCLFLDWDSADDCKLIKKMNVCWLRQQQSDEDGDAEHMEIGSEEGRKITENSEHLKIEQTYKRGECDAKLHFFRLKFAARLSTIWLEKVQSESEQIL